MRTYFGEYVEHAGAPHSRGSGTGANREMMRSDVGSRAHLVPPLMKGRELGAADDKWGPRGGEVWRVERIETRKKRKAIEKVMST